jgi:ribonuclease HI
MKINVDGAFKTETGPGRETGAAIRNGEVAKAGAGNISHTMGAFHAEMIAAQEGIRLAAQSQILVFPPRN